MSWVGYSGKYPLKAGQPSLLNFSVIEVYILRDGEKKEKYYDTKLSFLNWGEAR